MRTTPHCHGTPALSLSVCALSLSKVRVEDAYVLEHKIKGWRREKKIALIEGRFGDLPRLSRAGSHKQVEESS
jgi:predicted GIY-YIG superfamily endonuclease